MLLLIEKKLLILNYAAADHEKIVILNDAAADQEGEASLAVDHEMLLMLSLITQAMLIMMMLRLMEIYAKMLMLILKKMQNLLPVI